MTREPRDLALERLYQAEMLGSVADSSDLPPKAARLVAGVQENQPALDQALEEVSAAWPVHRMPVVDRCILRMSLYELRSDQDLPVAVIVAEAVRLAKAYSTEKSGAFVNGVLAELARRERRTEV